MLADAPETVEAIVTIAWSNACAVLKMLAAASLSSHSWGRQPIRQQPAPTAKKMDPWHAWQH